MAYQEGDIEYPISQASFDRLREFALTHGKANRWSARSLVDRLLAQARYVRHDFSLLEFRKPEPQVRFFATQLDISDRGILALCKAGRFGPGDLLDVALRLEGLKQ